MNVLSNINNTWCVDDNKLHTDDSRTYVRLSLTSESSPYLRLGQIPPRFLVYSLFSENLKKLVTLTGKVSQKKLNVDVQNKVSRWSVDPYEVS